MGLPRARHRASRGERAARSRSSRPKNRTPARCKRASVSRHPPLPRGARRLIALNGPVAAAADIVGLSGSSMQFEFLLEQVVNGLVLGGYYLLIALGLSLIFSVGGVVNLAHGAFYALGAYVSVEITKYLGFGPAVVLSPVAVAMLGILFERYILRRFYTADPILSLLVTFGLAMVAEQAIRIIWGAAPLSASIPPVFRGSVIVGDFLFSRYRADAARGGGRRAARRLAAAAQDLVRPRGARRHPAAGHGGGAGHPAAALHDRDRHARRRHGGDGRRVLRADHHRASGDGRRDHHGGLRRGGDRRARAVSGAS